MAAQNRPPVVFVSPSKYVQGPGTLDLVDEYVAPLGRKATVVCSSRGWARFGERLTASAARSGLELLPYEYTGESSMVSIDGGVAHAEANSADLVIGLGGGKATDTAKAVGARCGVPWVMIPTLASNDGPTSSLTVVYTEEGELTEYILHRRSPDLLLVDTQVIADASPRFLAAGMADAVSTRFESAACAAAGAVNIVGGRPSAAALTLGANAWDIITTHGVSALRACERNAVTESLELIVETNTLNSGLGFESGGFSAAHSFHNGLTMLREADGALHGEKVNFGVLAMLVLQRRPDRELDEYIEFSNSIGVPVTLSELGISSLSDEDLQRAAERTVAEGEGIHSVPFPVTAEMAGAAIAAADAYAGGYRAEKGATATPQAS